MQRVIKSFPSDSVVVGKIIARKESLWAKAFVGAKLIVLHKTKYTIRPSSKFLFFVTAYRSYSYKKHSDIERHSLKANGWIQLICVRHRFFFEFMIPGFLSDLGITGFRMCVMVFPQSRMETFWERRHGKFESGTRL